MSFEAYVCMYADVFSKNKTMYATILNLGIAKQGLTMRKKSIFYVPANKQPVAHKLNKNFFGFMGVYKIYC